MPAKRTPVELLLTGATCLIAKTLKPANVGIRDGKIVYVGPREPPAETVLPLTGKYLIPGCIDVHSHSDLYTLKGRRAIAKVSQGITCEVTGNCGLGVFPLPPGAQGKNYLAGYAGIFGKQPPAWRTFAGYRRQVKTHSPVNVRCLSSYATLRFVVGGMADRPLTQLEQRRLKKILAQELEEGSAGLALGMIYPPNCYATEEEVRDVLSLVSEYRGRVVACHLWNEGNRVEESVRRWLRLTDGYELRLELSHLKAYGRANWHKMARLLRQVERAARTRAIEFDLYPYTAGSTTANALLPPWALAYPRTQLVRKLRDPGFIRELQEYFRDPDPEWENYLKLVGSRNVKLINLHHFAAWEGASLHAIARHLGKDEVAALCAVLAGERGRAAMLLHAMRRDNLLLAYRSPLAKVGSDGLFGDAMHPRTYGTMGEFIDVVWRKSNTLTLAEAFYKMTTQGYEFFGMKQRGRIKKGYYADLTVLDLDHFAGQATYAEPRRLCTGVDKVFIGGRLAFAGGKVRGLHGAVITD